MVNHLTNSSIQTVASLINLKMESPIKKPVFDMQADKENIALQSCYETDEVAVPIKGIPSVLDLKEEETKTLSVAPTIKVEEAVEPLLQENPQRFVLFPIKYHEVRKHARETRHA